MGTFECADSFRSQHTVTEYIWKAGYKWIKKCYTLVVAVFAMVLVCHLIIAGIMV